MAGIKVLIKGLNKVIDFPSTAKMADIETAIKGNWSKVEEMSGLPMDKASKLGRYKSLGFAPALVGAGALAPEDVEASFLGQGAKKAAMDMLGMANKMENAGIKPDEIWNKTGWGKGADNKWRFEVDDSTSRIVGDDRDYNKELLATFEDGSGSASRKQILADKRGQPKPPHEETNLLSAVLDHPNLYEQYPELKNTLYSRRDDLPLGNAYYDESLDTIGMSGTNRNATKSPLAHETQHAIQSREGFAKGGNVNEFGRGDVNLVTARSEQLKAEVDNVLGSEAYQKERVALRQEGKERWEIKALLDKKYNIGEKIDELYAIEDTLRGKTSFEQYQSLAGETESRNVESRLNMTQEERRATPPWKTEDVPRGEQIVKYGGAGAALGLAGLSPEDAQAQQMWNDRARMHQPFIDDLIASRKDADIGGFDAPYEQSPDFIRRGGHLLNKLDTPIGNPLEGVANYLINFGYKDPAAEKLKRAANASLDLL